MVRTFQTDLSVKGINRVIAQIEQYRTQTLPRLIEQFVNRLSDIGLNVGRTTLQTDKGARNFIVFSKTFQRNEDGVVGMVIATETGHITSRWMTKEGLKEADVSPLLMTEWGSGRYAAGFELTLPDGTKVGRGTFPGQTHAFEKDGWYWYDENGELHHSYGWEPSRPVYTAWAEMETQILTVAKEVFG